MTKDQLDKILADHKLWRAGKGSARANLTNADLNGVNFTGADLRNADFSGAYLDDADLTRALLG